MVPSGWQPRKLNEVCTLINGRAYNKDELLDHGKYPVLRVGNFFTNENWYFSDLELESSKYCDTGDLLYAWSASFGPRIWQGSKVIYHYHIWKIEPNTSVIDKFFLYSFLEWDVSRIKAAQGTGSTMMHVTKSSMDQRGFMLPPLSEQKRIAEVLGSVDAAIEATHAVIEQTKKVKQGLLQTLLTQGIGHTKFKDSPLGKIPQSWEVKALGALCKRKGEYGANAAAVDYVSGHPRYIRITDIDDQGKLLENTVKGIIASDAAEYILEEDDFLFARSGATVGKTYRHKTTNGLCAFAGYLIRFRTDGASLLPAFLEEITRSESYKKWIRDTLRAGAQPNINAQEYASMPIALPPVSEQLKIVEVTNGINSQLSAETSKLATLQQLKKGLMHDLLTGKVRVA